MAGQALRAVVRESRPARRGLPALPVLAASVPEPTTMIVGALLLLSFGASTLRMLRKSRKA